MGTSQSWIDRGLTHVAKTYGRYPLVAASGEGCWLTDIDGKKYLDFLAGVAVNNLGHCHPDIPIADHRDFPTSFLPYGFRYHRRIASPHGKNTLCNPTNPNIVRCHHKQTP